VVAKTGRAEVLKALGRYEDALAAYEAASKAHPENAASKNGRAEVLKALGRYEDALAAYEAARKAHPEDAVAKNGRAEVLKALGRYEDALAAYEAASKAHTEDAVAKNGRACLLAKVGRSREALALLPDFPITRANDWIGYHIRGMVLLRQGNVDEAIQIFNRGVSSCPMALQRDYFHTALAVAHLRRREYAVASEILAQVKLSQVQATNLISIHAFGTIGQTQAASEASRRLIDPVPIPIAELVEELRRRYVRGEPPKHSDDWVFEQEADALLIAAYS
jgi:tetratricopeptide (TPR) repeat protein